ncbi:hypothetical protein ABIB73_005235 [Bradyrhizobium sp. F1.4.3]
MNGHSGAVALRGPLKKRPPQDEGSIFRVTVSKLLGAYRSNAAFSALRCGTSGLPIVG